ncbi:unnamed protein product [Alopecurus aequalis]
MNFWMGKAQSKNDWAYDGAIFLCNHLTRKECFDRKMFGLSSKCTDFIQRVKAGAALFLYDVNQHKLHGVFEATSDGAMNIVPDAYASTGFQYPCQIRFKRIWFCKPLMESEFEDAVQDNYFYRNKFTYGLSHQQVVKLLHLFSSRNRLQPRQNPRLQYEQPRGSEISSVINQTDNQSGSISSSHGSLKSPCQTCTSSTVGEDAASPSHKLPKPMSLMHGELQLDISDVAKSNSSRSSLHTPANADIVTDPGSQEEMDDKFTDDYIPLQLEEDIIDGVDDLLGYESGSSESKGSGDSEEHATFHQSSGIKEDYCHQPMENSKLRADIEGRKSVFARLLGRPKSFSQKSKTKPFASMNAKSFSPLSHSQRKKRRRAQQNKTFRCDKRAMFDMPLADKMRRIPALNYSFVWDDDRRSNKFTGGKPSNIQTGQHPYLREDVNRWDVSTKEPDRYDASKKMFVPEGSKQLAESRDRELEKLPVFAEVHESCEVTVKEKIRTPFSDFKRRAKDPNVEGGEQDFETEDVEEAARKKMRLASASNQREEYQSETALIQGTKPIDVLKISDGDCKLESITLSSNDTSTQMASAYPETEVLLQDEQKRIQGCCEDVTGDKFMNLGDFGNAPKLSFSNRQTILNVETSSEVAFGHLETETSLHEKQNQSARSCYGVVNTDEMLVLGKPETMDFSPNHDEDCGSRMCLPSDGNARHVASNHLVAEMPPQEKQTPNIQSCSQVVHCDEVLVPESSEEMFPKFDANCERNKSLSSDEAYNHVEVSHLDTHMPLQEKPCQRAPGCREIVDEDQELCWENSVTLETSPKYDRRPVKNSLSSDGISGYVASDLYSSDDSPDPDSPECHGESANKNILPDGTLEMAATDHQEICKLSQDEPFRSLSGTMDTSTGDELLTPEDCGKVDLLPKLSFGDMQTTVETRIEVDFSHAETETSLQLQEKQNQSAGSCYAVVNAADKMLHLENPETMEDLSPNHDEDGILQMLDTDHQETFSLPQGKQIMPFCGDTSSVLEYSGTTVDTSTVDGDIEHKTSSYQKDAEATYSPTRSEDEEDTTNTMSLDRRQSSSPPYDAKLSKAVPQPETQHGAAHEGDCDHKTSFYQKVVKASFSLTGSEDHEDTTNTLSLNRPRSSSPPCDQELSKAAAPQHGLAHHENSDSTDPFAVCAEGYGNRGGIPAGSTSTHLVVADLIGTKSESRTGFFDGFSRELAEMMMLAHDPGEEMEPH